MCLIVRGLGLGVCGIWVQGLGFVCFLGAAESSMGSLGLGNAFAHDL